LPAADAGIFQHIAQKRRAAGATPAFVMVRKPLADIAKGQCAQNGIGDGMKERISIRMALETPWRGQPHATQPKLPADNAAMEVIALADSQHVTLLSVIGPNAANGIQGASGNDS